MNTKSKSAKRYHTQEAIDRAVEAQANDDSAWEKPIKVKRNKAASLSIPAELAARALFLAKIHRETRLDDWLKRIIKERIELEEVAYANVKRELIGSDRIRNKSDKIIGDQA